MAYIVPIHRPSSVRHALKLKLLDPEQECLVLAKSNRIELWELLQGGLVMTHSKAIYGSVSMLAKIRPAGSTTDHLFIGTARFQYFTVVWNSNTGQLETAQEFVDVSEKHMRDAVSRDRCLVDPTGHHLVMELFEGVLNLVKILKPKKGVSNYLDSPVQVRITELKVRATTFLYTETTRPKLAFLWEDPRGDTRLTTYWLVDEKGQYSNFEPEKRRENDIGGLDPGASLLIPVPKGKEEQKRYIVRNVASAKAQLGGVIVVGETRMTYLDDESKASVDYALDEASIFVAWEKLGDLHYLLADNYGVLHLLTIMVDVAVVTGMEVQILGRTSKASVMVHMGDGVVFIGSHEGDSQVIRVHLDSIDPSVKVLQSMPNMAPILDFEIMDLGGKEGENHTNEYSSGQARLVTGSGAFENGSLRSVRSGVGLDDTVILADMEYVRGLYALRSSEEVKRNDILIATFLTETRIFKFENGEEIEELDNFRNMRQDCHTLLVMNISNLDRILQVTSSSVALLGPLQNHDTTHKWEPPKGQLITAVSANQSSILLALNGVTLVSLDIQNLLQQLSSQPLNVDDQVACIHVPSAALSIGIVGFWKSGSISLLDIQTLEVLHSEDLRRKESPSIPRDIVMAQLLPPATSGPTLFVAMEDGIVFTFSVDKDLSTRSTETPLSARKSVVLGTEQAEFTVLPRADSTDVFNVFATCEHPSLIYGSEGRIVYSAVTADNAVCVSPFDSEAYSDSIIVATASQLKICKIDTERRTHINTLHVGETVRRIAYSAKERVFGIGCIKRDLIDGAEVVNSTFRLVEEVMLREQGEPFNLQNGTAQELVECVIRAELPVAHGNTTHLERFLVGTSYLEEEPGEGDVRGRLLVLGVDSSTRSPYLIGSLFLRGACRRLAILDGKIVAALVKTVVVYDYLETASKAAAFTKLATYRTSTCPIDLSITGNIIAIADLMKSVSLVEYTPGKDGLAPTLTETCRHYQSCWATAVVNIDGVGKEYLESDHHGNLIVLRRNEAGVTFEDRRRMEVTSEYNLGEMVNCMRPIKVEPTANAMVVPKAFLATTEGSIQLFATISPTSQDLLMRLQMRLATTIHALGNNTGFNTYRAFKNPERETAEPFRFVDGELIERFLDLSEEVQREICKGLGPSVESLRGLVEELRRLH